MGFQKLMGLRSGRTRVRKLDPRQVNCLDYILTLDPKRVELTSRAYEYVFIGYAINSETYRFYDLNKFEEVRKQELLKSMNLVYTLEEYPLSFKKAISLMDAELWQEAINDEMDFLESNKT
ncbi:phytoene synthase, putative [Medicago truncatula]|uniref:Phytoene synthase, putative n=1 Tax=Medicago truncatula TaxID=3880 RepID=G7JK16_MEDTR|nr:phytoene synthase, putative [Medicago truncatula]